MEHKVHQGRNVKRFREMLGIKQDILAFDLGPNWSQTKVSLLEQKEEIERDILEQISSVLKIPVEAFENFNDEQAIYNISCSFSGNSSVNGTNIQNFNPVDQIIELHKEKIALFERMLSEKEEMIERMERLLQTK